MRSLLGEHACRLDSKKRLLLPAALLKQIPPEGQERFVINRGFKPSYLVLYPGNVWDLISAQVERLNQFNEKNLKFVRYFFRGATPLRLDKQNRLLLPKSLLEYAEINENITLIGLANRIEIWSQARYEEMLSEEPEDFMAFAEEVMGELDFEIDTGGSGWRH